MRRNTRLLWLLGGIVLPLAAGCWHEQTVYRVGEPCQLQPADGSNAKPLAFGKPHEIRVKGSWPWQLPPQKAQLLSMDTPVGQLPRHCVSRDPRPLETVRVGLGGATLRAAARPDARAVAELERGTQLQRFATIGSWLVVGRGDVPEGLAPRDALTGGAADPESVAAFIDARVAAEEFTELRSVIETLPANARGHERVRSAAAEALAALLDDGKRAIAAEVWALFDPPESTSDPLHETTCRLALSGVYREWDNAAALVEHCEAVPKLPWGGGGIRIPAAGNCRCVGAPCETLGAVETPTGQFWACGTGETWVYAADHHGRKAIVADGFVSRIRNGVDAQGPGRTLARIVPVGLGLCLETVAERRGKLNHTLVCMPTPRAADLPITADMIKTIALGSASDYTGWAVVRRDKSYVLCLEDERAFRFGRELLARMRRTPDACRVEDYAEPPE